MKKLDVLVLESDKKNMFYENTRPLKNYFKNYNNLNITYIDTYEKYLKIRDNSFDITLLNFFLPFNNNKQENKEHNKKNWLKILQDSQTKINNYSLNERLFFSFVKKAKPFNLDASFVSNAITSLQQNDINKFNQIYDNNALNTAPYGVEIFLDRYYHKNEAVMLVNSRKLLQTNNVFILAYLQNKSLLEFNDQPISSVNPEDIRFYVLNSKAEIEDDFIYRISLLHRLIQNKYKKELRTISMILAELQSKAYKNIVLRKNMNKIKENTLIDGLLIKYNVNNNQIYSALNILTNL